MLLGLVAAVVGATWRGELFYGENYKGLALGTYSTLAVIIVACIVGAIWLGRRLYRRARRPLPPK
jgi:hypothetical protein